MIKTAVILAAGMGTRFGKHTEYIPKGFIKYKGIPMVIRSIETLLSCGIERIIIGTGYHQEAYEQLKEKYPQIITCYSPKYAETNSMYTLFNSKEVIGEDDFLLLESDIVFEKKAILSLLENDKKDIMLVAPVTKFQDQYYVEMNKEENLVNCSTNKEELDFCGELVGIHKISNTFYDLMYSDYKTKCISHPKLGYEFELLQIAKEQLPMYVLRVEGLQWYEIDDEADLTYAEKNIAIN